MKLFKDMKLIPTAVLVALVLASCATPAPEPGVESVTASIDVINSGDSAALLDLSSVPFAFDAEILKRGEDVLLLWDRLFDAGFNLSDAEIISIDPVNEQSFARFYDGFEMQTFFERYLSGQPAIARIGSGESEYLLIVGGSTGSELFGMKGPIR